jgi:ribosomal protein S18 acetylase RimI-like enzyme
MESDREAAEKLHRDCGEEYKDSGGAEICNGMTPWAFPGDISLVTETANGDFAAYACARRLPEKSEAGPVSSGETLSRLHITALEVRREYRGLGIGEELLRRLLETGAAEKNTLVSLDLPAGAEGFARVLLRESFKPQVVRYCRTGPVQ